MIAFLGLVWRRLTIGPCEDVGTLLDEWSDERARKAARVTERLDEGLTISSCRPAVKLDADTAAEFRREREIAAMLAEYSATVRADAIAAHVVAMSKGAASLPASRSRYPCWRSFSHCSRSRVSAGS